MRTVVASVFWVCGVFCCPLAGFDFFRSGFGWVVWGLFSIVWVGDFGFLIAAVLSLCGD